MRIALVVHKFPPASLGGTEIYSRDLARELSRRHELHLFYRDDALPGQNYADEQISEENWRTWRVRYTLAGAGDNPLRVFLDTFQNRRIEESFRRFLHKVRPDLVHFQHVMGLSARLIPLARERQLPVVLTLHDYWFLCSNSQLVRPDQTVCKTPANPLACVDCAAARVNLPILRASRPFVALPFAYLYTLVKRAARHADLFLAPSHFLLQKYVGGGFPAMRILYLENGLDVRRVQGLPRRPSHDGRVRFVYLGAIAWQKGVRILAEAFQGISPEVATLRIYGDPTVFPDYTRQLEALLTNPSTRLMGRLENEQVGQVLADADVLVVPSLWYENSPVVIQEAFAASVPVVASGLGALAEKVRDGVDGLLFRPGDAADLQDKIKLLLANHELLERLHRNVPPVRTIEEHTREVETLYASLAAKARV
jgi:glycosyltransferase involved in cell wall biosynthesis